MKTEKSGIMSHTEYRRVRREGPYKLKLQFGDKWLYYFGEKHSFDPKDKQWGIAEVFWIEFLKSTKNSKRIVFVEGGTRPKEATKEISITKHGGMGLATWLAAQESIETFSPEPDRKYERQELEKQFGRDEIQYYYFARTISQWNRMNNPKPDFNRYITWFLKDDEKNSGWTGYDFSLDHMKEIHKKNFNSDFNGNDGSFFYSVSNPLDENHITNKVARLTSQLRDKYIVGQIQKYLRGGYSVFSQYGFSHVVMQEPVDRKSVV